MIKNISMQNSIGKFSLVGAGPGDPDLLTIKGFKAIRSADVILYDALVDKVLLSFAENAEIIFVGKQKGCYACLQDQINELILMYALQGKHVVRLKGGDPFVFGRGAEEMEYVAQFGVECVYIPGISSAIAVAGLRNIPITKRGASESFWVITGTTKNHEMSADIKLAAKSNATVVILMGMSKLNEIVQCFKNENKSGLPVAVIEKGSTAEERICVGTVSNIVAISGRKGMKNPAVIVLGETVNNRSKMMDLYRASGVNINYRN